MQNLPTMLKPGFTKLNVKQKVDVMFSSRKGNTTQCDGDAPKRKKKATCNPFIFQEHQPLRPRVSRYKKKGTRKRSTLATLFFSHTSIIDVLKFKCCQRAASPAVH